MNDANSEDTKTPSGVGKKLGLGCGSFLILFFAFVAYLYYHSDEQLTERVSLLKKDIAKHRARDVSRAVIFGAARDGNAVWDYNAIEWMVGTRKDWETGEPAHLPKTQYAKDYFNTLKANIAVQTGILLKSLQENPSTQSEWSAQYRKKQSPAKTTKKLSKEELAEKAEEAATRKQELAVALAFHKKHARHLIKHVQAGLQRKECDWEYQFERGVDAPLTNIIGVRCVANMMAYEAHLASPPKGNELSLQILAYAQDLEQHPTLIGRLVAIAIKAIAFQSLERVLRRPLSQSDLKRSLDVMQAFEAIDTRKMLDEERLMFSVIFAYLGGFSISDEPLAENLDVSKLIGLNDDFERSLLSMKIPLLREWNAYEDYYYRFQKVLELPITEQESAMEEVLEDLESSYTVLARQVIPNVVEACKQVNEINIMRDLILIGVSARLHRLITGQWPSKTSELAPYLKNKVPLDIHTGRKKEYALKASGLDLRISCAPPPYSGSRQLIIRIRAAK